MQQNKTDIYSTIYSYLTQEQKLIIELCKVTPDSRDLELIKSSAPKSLDWKYIITFAKEHGLISLLYSNIIKNSSLVVPPDILVELKAYSLENSKKNLFWTSALLEIIEGLKQVGIESVAFKGPVLSNILYDDITVREFSDIDIFVFAGDVLKAKII